MRAEDDQVDFAKDIQPIFKESCLKCRSFDPKKPKKKGAAATALSAGSKRLEWGMSSPPDGSKAIKRRRVAPRPYESPALERARIRAAMRNWRRMDETASLLGRGLGREELIGRVAREVGASLNRVRAALAGL